MSTYVDHHIDRYQAFGHGDPGQPLLSPEGGTLERAKLAAMVYLQDYQEPEDFVRTSPTETGAVLIVTTAYGEETDSHATLVYLGAAS